MRRVCSKDGALQLLQERGEQPSVFTSSVSRVREIGDDEPAVVKLHARQRDSHQ